MQLSKHNYTQKVVYVNFRPHKNPIHLGTPRLVLSDKFHVH
jgi:hypothetical protein